MDISAVESRNLSSALWHKSCKAAGFEDVLKTSPMKALYGVVDEDECVEDAAF